MDDDAVEELLERADNRRKDISGAPCGLELDPTPYLLAFDVNADRLTVEDAYWSSRVTAFSPKSGFCTHETHYPTGRPA